MPPSVLCLSFLSCYNKNVKARNGCFSGLGFNRAERPRMSTNDLLAPEVSISTQSSIESATGLNTVNQFDNGVVSCSNSTNVPSSGLSSFLNYLPFNVAGPSSTNQRSRRHDSTLGGRINPRRFWTPNPNLLNGGSGNLYPWESPIPWYAYPAGQGEVLPPVDGPSPGGMGTRNTDTGGHRINAIPESGSGSGEGNYGSSHYGSSSSSVGPIHQHPQLYHTPIHFSPFHDLRLPHQIGQHQPIHRVFSYESYGSYRTASTVATDMGTGGGGGNSGRARTNSYDSIETSSNTGSSEIFEDTHRRNGNSGNSNGSRQVNSCPVSPNYNTLENGYIPVHHDKRASSYISPRTQVKPPNAPRYNSRKCYTPQGSPVNRQTGAASSSSTGLSDLTRRLGNLQLDCVSGSCLGKNRSNGGSRASSPGNSPVSVRSQSSARSSQSARITPGSRNLLQLNLGLSTSTASSGLGQRRLSRDITNTAGIGDSSLRIETKHSDGDSIRSGSATASPTLSPQISDESMVIPIENHDENHDKFNYTVYPDHDGDDTTETDTTTNASTLLTSYTSTTTATLVPVTVPITTSSSSGCTSVLGNSSGDESDEYIDNGYTYENDSDINSPMHDSDNINRLRQHAAQSHASSRTSDHSSDTPIPSETPIPSSTGPSENSPYRISSPESPDIIPEHTSGIFTPIELSPTLPVPAPTSLTSTLPRTTDSTGTQLRPGPLRISNIAGSHQNGSNQRPGQSTFYTSIFAEPDNPDSADRYAAPGSRYTAPGNDLNRGNLRIFNGYNGSGTTVSSSSTRSAFPMLFGSRVSAVSNQNHQNNQGNISNVRSPVTTTSNNYANMSNTVSPERTGVVTVINTTVPARNSRINQDEHPEITPEPPERDLNLRGQNLRNTDFDRIPNSSSEDSSISPVNVATVTSGNHNGNSNSNSEGLGVRTERVYHNIPYIRIIDMDRDSEIGNSNYRTLVSSDYNGISANTRANTILSRPLGNPRPVTQLPTTTVTQLPTYNVASGIAATALPSTLLTQNLTVDPDPIPTAPYSSNLTESIHGGPRTSLGSGLSFSHRPTYPRTNYPHSARTSYPPYTARTNYTTARTNYPSSPSYAQRYLRSSTSSTGENGNPSRNRTFSHAQLSRELDELDDIIREFNQQDREVHQIEGASTLLTESGNGSATSDTATSTTNHKDERNTRTEITANLVQSRARNNALRDRLEKLLDSSTNNSKSSNASLITRRTNSVPTPSSSSSQVYIATTTDTVPSTETPANIDTEPSQNLSSNSIEILLDEIETSLQGLQSMRNKRISGRKTTRNELQSVLQLWGYEEITSASQVPIESDTAAIRDSSNTNDLNLVPNTSQLPVTTSESSSIRLPTPQQHRRYSNDESSIVGTTGTSTTSSARRNSSAASASASDTNGSFSLSTAARNKPLIVEMKM